MASWTPPPSTWPGPRAPVHRRRDRPGPVAVRRLHAGPGGAAHLQRPAGRPLRPAGMFLAGAAGFIAASVAACSSRRPPDAGAARLAQGSFGAGPLPQGSASTAAFRHGTSQGVERLRAGSQPRRRHRAAGRRRADPGTFSGPAGGSSSWSPWSSASPRSRAGCATCPPTARPPCAAWTAAAWPSPPPPCSCSSTR